MSADPYSLAEQFLYSVLSADSTLLSLINEVFPEVVPSDMPWEIDGAPQSYVVYIAPPGAEDGYAVGGMIVETTLVYIVKVVARTADTLALEPAVRRIHQLLHGVEGPVGATGYAVSCVRERPLKLIDQAEGGAIFLHRGGRYAITVQEEE